MGPAVVVFEISSYILTQEVYEPNGSLRAHIEGKDPIRYNKPCGSEGVIF